MQRLGQRRELIAEAADRRESAEGSMPGSSFLVVAQRRQRVEIGQEIGRWGDASLRGVDEIEPDGVAQEGKLIVGHGGLTVRHLDGVAPAPAWPCTAPYPPRRECC